VNPDLYGAWLTAGNGLQPVGAWIARNLPNLAVAAVLAVFAALTIRALRHATQRIDTALADIDHKRKEDR